MTEVSTLHVTPNNVEDMSRTVLAETGVYGFKLHPQASPEVKIKSCIFPNSHIVLHAYTSTGHEFSVSHLPYFTIDAMLKGTLVRALDNDEGLVDEGKMILAHPGHIRAQLVEDATTRETRGISCFVAPEAAECIMSSNGLKLTNRKGQVVTDDTVAASNATRRLLEYAHEEFFVRGLPHVTPGRARLFEALLSDHLAELFECHGYAEPQQRSVPDSVKLVLEFEEIAKSRFAEQVSVGELAQGAEINLRTLQRAFKRHRGISPSLYLSTLRLEAARMRLLSASATDTVTEIAFISGIAHLGRFSAKYRAAYGEAPQETLNRSRR
ncbi:helix-turn-helix domain-containing protein [Ruegeria profundi]|uniref:HTH araC/xylS-type domain-containing protein n=1 Tax=Ruegeria profundi TaxID=1685378 RepID=A0A0X3TD34_9RHOB|nr:helix-turn-helix domain-containing protein [Ruegeria profundi]KUJ72246.1 hypothetical protein AVO44_20390 [Ruegeria profundi]